MDIHKRFEEAKTQLERETLSLPRDKIVEIGAPIELDYFNPFPREYYVKIMELSEKVERMRGLSLKEMPKYISKPSYIPQSIRSHIEPLEIEYGKRKNKSKMS